MIMGGNDTDELGDVGGILASMRPPMIMGGNPLVSHTLTGEGLLQ